ncbi:MAG: hypothetical protein IJK92_02115 [Bacteroidales bacterium]|nr:hypothetical protein [Bacteroidales bacterium]
MKNNSDISLPTEVEQNASEIIRGIFADIEKFGYSRQKPFIIGAVEDRMKKYAEENNIELGSSDVYMSSHKVKIGKAVPKEDIIAFPMTRHNMDMSFDGDTFIFTDGKAKYVIQPNYAIKIERKREKKVYRGRWESNPLLREKPCLRSGSWLYLRYTFSMQRYSFF